MFPVEHFSVWLGALRGRAAAIFAGVFLRKPCGLADRDVGWPRWLCAAGPGGARI